LSTMSHEMRTPMNAITGMSAIGREADDIERKNYAFDKIDEAGRHLLSVINDVLDMSKIEAGKLELSDAPFDLNHSIGRVSSIIQFRVDEKQQELICHVNDDVPAVLVADDHRLTQVLTNLISNAVKFTPDNKKIHMNVSLLEKNDVMCKLQFDVTDQGIGLSKEQQGMLFQSFVQAEASTSRKFGGTGLGLAISKYIVEHMGGEIWIESELGEGAKFSFTMQAKLPTEKDLLVLIDKKSRKAAEAPSYEGKRLLLAEDVEINREIVLAMLEDTGIVIDIAINGEEAVKIFSESPNIYDLIFMDVHMPMMDGYEATRAIRELDFGHAKSVPIVALTANVFKEDVDKCLAAGMNAHLGKPLDFDAVKGVLKEYLWK